MSLGDVPRWWRSTLLAVLVAGCGGSSWEPGRISQQSPPASPTLVQGSFGQTFSYLEAPSSGGFPVAASVLEGYQARQDEGAMRAHAWSMWASVTALAPSGLPVMLTWYHNAEVFGEGRLAIPRRFSPAVLTGPPGNFGNGDPPTEINFYNQAYRDHVRVQGYQWREALLSLLGLGSSNVVDFPEQTIVAKTVWWPVRHDGLTALPVWDDQPTRPLEWGTGVDDLVDAQHFGVLSAEQRAELKSHLRHGNEWGTFARVVAIDPDSTGPGGTARVKFFDTNDLDYHTDAIRSAQVVPLSSFYTVRLSEQSTVDSLNAGVMGEMCRRFWGRELTQADSLALVAVHLTSRETENWVWATYWWHDGVASADRPPALPPPFDHFRLAVTQNADLPLAGDGGPNVAFNPYLEAGFAEGVLSNCMGCHQRAGWTASGPQSVMPVHRGSIPEGDSRFVGLLRTHFMWSLVFRPRPQTVNSPPLPAGDFVPEP